jgi:hypothetical protein
MGFFSVFRKKETSIRFVTVVSGLPRSGTSLMMQILAAGGMQIVTDEERSADQDNPKGYYELERVKKLQDGDTAWVKEAEGKAVKVISALLEGLPTGYTYKILFMQREMSEILASQRQMLARRGEPGGQVDDETMARLFEKHLENVQAWLAKQKNMHVLYLPYADLIRQPEAQIKTLVTFLAVPLDIQAMLAVPDPALYRNKGPAFPVSRNLC